MIFAMREDPLFDYYSDKPGNRCSLKKNPLLRTVYRLYLQVVDEEVFSNDGF